MGIGLHAIQAIRAVRKNTRGGAAVTLGRMSVFLNPDDLHILRRDFSADPSVLAWIDSYSWAQPADKLFTEVLGFDRVDSIDASEFEGATIVHDLNQPLPAELARQYVLAYNGGTLEHVFNFPTAVASFMDLVRPGGWAYFLGPSNNFPGHGFYQFSPELIFRIFAPENGFRLEFVHLVEFRLHSAPERTPSPAVFQVVDPAIVGERVTYAGRRPVNIAALAQRIDDVKPFTRPPQQSDYAAAWQDAGMSASKKSWKGRVAARLPWLRRQVLEVIGRRRRRLRSGGHFRRVDY